MLSSSPVFIIGAPRSGTTMLGSAIGAHSKCLALPESPFLSSHYSASAKIPLSKIFENITNHFRFKHWKLRNEDVERIGKDLCSFKSYPQLVSEFLKIYSQNNKKTNFTKWIEHSPANINRVTFLKKEFPDAKFIHIVRDGRAVANSIRSLDWGGNNILENITEWKNNLAFGFLAELSLSKDVKRVYYEDLIKNPESQLNEICCFLGISFEEEMLKGDSSFLPSYTKKQHSLVGSSFSAERIDSWQLNLSSRDIELFEFYCSSMLSTLGYSLVCDYEIQPPSFTERTRFWFSGFIKTELINRVRMKRRVGFI
ncbi:sulfotransferase [Persicobacter diffluens]|uniref:Sulfotransferase n=1 Tax=Persicobacter diffluens TaxID=981 RepID=A0AAN4VZ58_9BACT|nr:sulfotransferase [Persicobacter diffluens]